MILRDSEFKGTVDYKQVLVWANNSQGVDKEGYRAEFIRLVESARLISNI